MLESIAKTAPQNATVRRTIGESLLNDTAVNSANGVYGVFRQLVGNCSDADADLATVTITDKLVEIEDDGHGMSPDDVEHKWLKSGDSSKVELKKSPKGRPYLGHFGIASASIINIAGQYILETAKDGVFTELTERVGEGYSTRKDLNMISYKVNQRFHGTKLTISDLKFIQGPRFSIEGLIRYLSLTLPIGDHTGFKVRVNGQELKSATFENARVFRFDRTGTFFGQAQGFIYLATGIREDAGIYVKVHGEVQADPLKVAKVEQINSRMAPKLIAVIHADGLKDSCRLNRDSFNNTPAYNEFVDALDEELRLVSRFADQIGQVSKAGRNAVNIKKQLSNLAGDYIKARVAEVNYQTRFKEEKGLPEHTVAVYHPETNSFGINANNPQITGAPNKPFVYYVMLHGVAEAIALHRHNLNAGMDFLLHKHEVLKHLARGQKTGSEGLNADVVANAYYNTMELIKPLGLPAPGIDYFIEHKFLQRSQHGILGQDAIELEKRMNGYLALPQFVRDNIKGDEYAQRLANVQIALSSAAEKLYTFVVDLSNGNKCYFIEPVLIQPIAGLIQGLITRGEADKAGDEFEKFGERYLSQAEVGTLLARHDITEIILYDKLGFEVRTQGRNSSEKFHFADCVKAMQIYREATKPKLKVTN